MAIYHFSAKIVSRGNGQSAVASAAYRAGDKLFDRRLGLTFDYTRKWGVEHTEILAPQGASDWVFNRDTLWNTVEETERRKDAQLARDIEVGLPVELTPDEQITLLRDFTQRTLVSEGMVADMAIHRDNPQNPHGHILLTMRGLKAQGFGLKRREWNQRAQLMKWRERWAEFTNEHLLQAGHDIRVDHRTLEAQGLDLVPGRKIGISAERQQLPDLPRNVADRVAEQRAIAAENGERILEDPALALRALTHYQATFTERDIAKFLHTRTDGPEQFQAAYLKVTTSPELTVIGQDDRGHKHFTTQEMLTLERELLDRAERLAERKPGSQGHAVEAHYHRQALAENPLSEEQGRALEHITAGPDLTVLVGVAGAGKSTMLKAARHAWEAAGYTVKGGTLSGIAAENLEHASGIPSRTLASWERSWSTNRDALTHGDILVIDEAGLVGTRQLARVLENAEKAGSKVVLVGDPEQLQAIEAGAPFRAIATQAGFEQLTEVRRQQHEWQKEATQRLAKGRTAEALSAYERAGRLHSSATREAAREAMLSAWRQAEHQRPGESRLMLAYTRADVQALNLRARQLRQEAGELGKSEQIETARGPREFAAGDRLYFFKNERSLGVKNGSLGTVEKIQNGILQIQLDSEDGRRVVVDSRQYPHLDHGYAATVHKAQGATVDRTYVLASPHFDRHATYVALSRHREAAALFYGREDFQPDWSLASPEANLTALLSRARPKTLAHDYLHAREDSGYRQIATEEGHPASLTSPLTPEERAAYIDQVRRRARAAWTEYRESQHKALERSRARRRQLDHGPDHD